MYCITRENFILCVICFFVNQTQRGISEYWTTLPKGIWYYPHILVWIVIQSCSTLKTLLNFHEQLLRNKQQPVLKRCFNIDDGFFIYSGNTLENAFLDEGLFSLFWKFTDDRLLHICNVLLVLSALPRRSNIPLMSSSSSLLCILYLSTFLDRPLPNKQNKKN